MVVKLLLFCVLFTGLRSLDDIFMFEMQEMLDAAGIVCPGESYKVAAESGSGEKTIVSGGKLGHIRKH